MTYGVEVLTQYGMVNVLAKRLTRNVGQAVITSSTTTGTATAPAEINSNNSFVFKPVDATSATLTFSGSTVTATRLGDYSGGVWSITVFFMRLL